jgi:hypothetical protein
MDICKWRISSPLRCLQRLLYLQGPFISFLWNQKKKALYERKRTRSTKGIQRVADNSLH